MSAIGPLNDATWALPTPFGGAATTTQGFTVEIGHLHGYEGGKSGQSHPENADPDQRVDKMELSTPY